MTSSKRLQQRSAAVAQRWLAAMLHTHRRGSPAFSTGKKDQFADPVGHSFATETKQIVDALFDGADPLELAPHLETLIKIRAIQEGRPSEAISFVTQLKGVLRDELAGEPGDERTAAELRQLEERIDQMTMVAVDILVSCRERICEIRINEVKRAVHTLRRRAAASEEKCG